jgi:hypothetical protein
MSCNLIDKQNRERKDREQQMQNNRKSLLSVEFDGCEPVTDVSCFRYAKVIKFHRCPNVTNVNSLKNSMELVFQYYDGVADVSELGRVKKMEIRYCRNLHDLSGLSTVHTLAVSLVPENLLSSLNQNTVLHLSYFLTDCYSIQFLEGNKLLRELNIYGLKYIQDISMLNTVEVLNISTVVQLEA